MASNNAAGLAFIIYTAHLLPMFLTEGLRRTTRTRRRATPLRIKKLFQTSRVRRWSFPWVYVSIAPQLWMASLGLGLITTGLPWALPYVLVIGLCIWRFILIRVGPEEEGRPHTPGLRPQRRRSVILNYLADLPFAAIALAVGVVAEQAIWILSVVLIISYSFVVRAGQYVGDPGAYAYSAALMSLVLGVLVIWPVSAKWYPEWTDWPGWLVVASLGVLEVLFIAIDVKIAISKRIMHIVCLALVLTFTVWVGFLKQPIEFSESAILTQDQFGSNAWRAALTAAILPLGFYLFLMQVGEKREWLLRGISDLRNFQFWRRTRRGNQA
jgi:hypothetical protein